MHGDSKQFAKNVVYEQKVNNLSCLLTLEHGPTHRDKNHLYQFQFYITG